MRITKASLLEEIKDLKNALFHVQRLKNVLIKNNDEIKVRDLAGFISVEKYSSLIPIKGEIGKVGEYRFITELPRSITFKEFIDQRINNGKRDDKTVR